MDPPTPGELPPSLRLRRNLEVPFPCTFSRTKWHDIRPGRWHPDGDNLLRNFDDSGSPAEKIAHDIRRTGRASASNRRLWRIDTANGAVRRANGPSNTRGLETPNAFCAGYVRGQLWQKWCSVFDFLRIRNAGERFVSRNSRNRDEGASEFSGHANSAGRSNNCGKPGKQSSAILRIWTGQLAHLKWQSCNDRFGELVGTCGAADIFGGVFAFAVDLFEGSFDAAGCGAFA